MEPKRKLRCAIYTRKSSEEGLEQDFNSLHAQRDSCAAYVLSQAGEGWEAIKTHYDDGGFSGGSLERPALQQLLTDITAGKVDIIVVYKVDRLTRSLSDFAKIVEIFDDKGVSFVSVTQAFNTTTSMGRLTLNILLSFAQFEREVTGERIRDKFAASRKKGIWMGGHPPLGYDISDRKLIVNNAEAEKVRGIFERYMTLKSVPALMEELAETGVKTKHWTSTTGAVMGNKVFSRGALYHLLRNRVYIGEATHKGKNYPGLHDPIVDDKTWTTVQDLLTANTGNHWATIKRSNSESPLKGLLFDDRGNPMSPSFTSKSRGRYRYYVSQALLQHRKADAGSVARIAGPEIERNIETILSDAIPYSSKERPLPEDPAGKLQALLQSVDRIVVKSDTVTVALHPDHVASIDEAACVQLKATISHKQKKTVITVPVRWIERGGETLLMTAKSEIATEPRKPDAALIKAVARAWRWRAMFENGVVQSIPELAQLESINQSYIKKALKLAFLPPAMIEDILAGRQCTTANLASLMNQDLRLDWKAQPPTLRYL